MVWLAVKVLPESALSVVGSYSVAALNVPSAFFTCTLTVTALSPDRGTLV